MTWIPVRGGSKILRRYLGADPGGGGAEDTILSKFAK